MTKKKQSPRKGPANYQTPNSFRRQIQRRNPGLDQRKQIPVTQHRV